MMQNWQVTKDIGPEKELTEMMNVVDIKQEIKKGRKVEIVNEIEILIEIEIIGVTVIKKEIRTGETGIGSENVNMNEHLEIEIDIDILNICLYKLYMKMVQK